jgi:O-6-methylguanine DNA methyltransferase
VIYYWIFEANLLGRLRLASTDVGLCKLSLGREDDGAFFSWLERVVFVRRGRVAGPSSLVHQKTRLIGSALMEIDAYLAGAMQSFKTSLDFFGTSFQRQVWNEVMAIPYGTTATYAEVARRIGRPKAVRAVGAANGANPLPLFVPCHRVVGADGTLRGYGGGLDVKAALLDLESRSAVTAK